VARNEQLIRQHRLLQILERAHFGRTLRELRDELVEQLGLTRISQRTVRRDLEALQAAGIDVATHSGRDRTVWKLGPGLRKLPKITSSVSEILALFVARELLVPLTGTPYWQGIETLWHKLQEALPLAVWQHFERHRASLVVRGVAAKSYADKHGILSTLNRAILQHRAVTLEYRSAGQQRPQRREIEPYAVAIYQGSLHLVAMACEAPPEEAFRHFKLDRIRKVTALDRRFTPQPGFSLEKHFAHSLGVYRAQKPATFRIWLSAKAAAWVREEPWHPKQQVDPRECGDVVLTLPAAYEDEIVPRVLGLGAEAEILAPESARRKVAAILQTLLPKYLTAPTV
jgi:predicted DNA-binding transcriptional regulator YafY